MKNFIFQNPTKLVFGKGEIARLNELIPQSVNLMVTFGGGSVTKNGVYDQVKAALKGRNFIEFWGIEPNPHVETLRKAIELGKSNNIDYLLAVGGGSVLDGTKLVAAGIASDEDAWDIVLKGFAERQIPFSSVLTVPATGSEMNGGAVITRAETREKFAFGGNYPHFSILDPEVTYSLSSHQIACGLADAYTHVLEQYLTTPGQSRLMDRWAEGILLSIIEIAPQIKENPHNYDLMADYMLAATLALNDFIRMGVTQDWATHQIGHELTALHGITHGHTLAIVMPGTMRVLKDQKEGKLLQYGERVFGITEGTVEERVEKAIEKTEAFYRSLGLTTRLSEEKVGNETIEIIANRFNTRGVAFGENRNVTGDVARKILHACL
ncbi:MULTISPECIES: iron-containing alcohol dehydrogenase [Petrimonas]|jgi:NADP-dependent alcohol dehydrogenase|uniref:Alcohol dehydrogenase YqhD n=1 Tax=Petrimonas mucosa TaxID=1642646 RepID=A0A1G4G9H5_9BACT|nr:MULTISPECIES: iron-containing alcohol dehydrogenase [Petrimonas]MDD3560035.1 iron-containing alcohol dehydrogenase [Petrimonas mucosa]SCM59203.1 Alcohol dehydrogenase YqhD [Petrimonas mucosa]SFU30235.1 NADP-dependent alcohol dehydrogenase [Porphyromonadaceae bacterium KHP3R9]HHT28845.1 iron-containing alcohol dehydrogenase [Petrimonas mucosa]